MKTLASTLSAIGPIMLFHFAVGVSTIGGSPSIGADRSQTPQIFVLAGAATLVCSACAVSLAMLIPVWMPPRSALAVICVSWLAGGSLAAILPRDGLGVQFDNTTEEPYQPD